MPADNLPFVSPSENTPWFLTLNRYQWFVLVVAAMGWLFDTMDQQLFILAASPALESLLEAGASVSSYRGLATSIFIAGWATGGLVFGLFGDRIGRTRTMVLTILMYSVFTGLSALSQTWIDFASFRFLTGMGVGGEFAAGVALVSEVMPARARPYAVGLLQASSTIGNMTAAVINLIIPPADSPRWLSWAGVQGVEGWRLMFLVGLVPALLVVFIRRGLKEPESWIKARQAAADDFARQMGDVKELVRDGRWRYHSIVGVLLGMAGVMGLWGVTFWLPELIREIVPTDLAASRYVYVTHGMLLLNVGAAFGIYGFSVIAGYIGRRSTFALAYFFALVSTVFVFGFMTDVTQLWWMPPILGFFTLMIFGGFAVYFPELYPTRLRATGTGLCYNVARYLAAIAPFVLGRMVLFYSAPEGTERFTEHLSELTLLSSLGGADQPLRYAALTVALIYLLGLIVLPFAPETKDKPLPE